MQLNTYLCDFTSSTSSWLVLYPSKQNIYKPLGKEITKHISIPRSVWLPKNCLFLHKILTRDVFGHLELKIYIIPY